MGLNRTVKRGLTVAALAPKSPTNSGSVPAVALSCASPPVGAGLSPSAPAVVSRTDGGGFSMRGGEA